jgi:hypothetical protein
MKWKKIDPCSSVEKDRSLLVYALYNKPTHSPFLRAIIETDPEQAKTICNAYINIYPLQIAIEYTLFIVNDQLSLIEE